MPELAVTDRDRWTALRIGHNQKAVDEIFEALAQARREGREEGRKAPEARLEELRPVVRAAILWLSDDYRTTGYAADKQVEIRRLDDIFGKILVLSPATRAWAEGSQEEKT